LLCAPSAGFRAAVDVVDRCGYAVGILTEPGKLATRAHLRADLLGALAQHALEAGLVDE